MPRDLDNIKPAPPIDTEPIRENFGQSEEANVPKFDNPDEWANWGDLKDSLKAAGGAERKGEQESGKNEEEVKVEKNLHDEL